jgi:hypothetical protein
MFFGPLCVFHSEDQQDFVQGVRGLIVVPAAEDASSALSVGSASAAAVVDQATKKPLMTQRLRCVLSDVFQSMIGAQEGTRTPTMLLAST